MTPPLTLFVGPDRVTLALPADLLLRRSPYFHSILALPGIEAASRSVAVPDVTVSVFRHVFVWLMDPRPHLESTLPLALLVDLAIFATRHELPALLHQALDRLRQKLVADRALWTPHLLDVIYTDTPDGCLLRSLTQRALTVLDGLMFSHSDPLDQKLRPWLTLFEAHPDLGRDFFLARMKGWSTHHLSTSYDNHCRFHRHLNPPGPQTVTRFGDTCSRMTSEPFEDQTLGLQLSTSGPPGRGGADSSISPPASPLASPQPLTMLTKNKKKKLRRLMEAQSVADHPEVPVQEPSGLEVNVDGLTAPEEIEAAIADDGLDQAGMEQQSG